MAKPKMIGRIDLDGTTTVQDVVHTRTEKCDAYGNPSHKFSVPLMITRQQAIDLQIELGYHPAGYSFHSFKATPTNTTWYCWGSCD